MSNLGTSISFDGREIKFELRHTEGERHKSILEKNWIYEPEVIGVSINYLKAGDICIDAGANLGYHSLLFSRLVGDNGKVLAIDADQDSIAKCLANLELNKIDNVGVIEAALWENKRCFKFYETLSGYSSFIEYTNMELKERLVFTKSLDDIFSEDFPIRLLKVDCEGAEEGILRGAKRLLENGIDCVIVELNFHILEITGGSERRIRDYMSELGYDCYALYQDGQKPQHLLHHWGVEPVGTKHLNVMFTRKNLPDWQSWSSN